MAGNILVFGEMEQGRLAPLTTQLLGMGKGLSISLKGELHLLLLGGKGLEVGGEELGYGEDRVYLAQDPLLETYLPDSYLQVLEQIVTKLKPEIVFFGQNDKGMDLAPRLAFRLNTSVILDCVHLEVNDASRSGQLKVVKPVFGGKAHRVFSLGERRPQILSVREGTFKPAVPIPAHSGEVIHLDVPVDRSQIRIRFCKRELDGSLSMARKLSSASVVVSGGRGLGKGKAFELLKETAKLLGGAIGGSRPAVDQGWIPNVLQIGLTGRKLSPEVYFAIGISGAMQHMAGCRNAKTVVAINNNQEAPIFRMSHYGVVGDYREVLRGFNDEYRRAKADGR